MKAGNKVVAEIGQNHNGSYELGCKLIDQAKKAGCYSIKLAKRDIDSFSKHWKEVIYNHSNSFGENYYEHRKKLELSNIEFANLVNEAKSKGLLVGSSFTDKVSLDLLCEMEVDYLKIASSRVADIELLKEVAQKKLPVILSTGMSANYQIEYAIHLLKSVPYLVIMQCTSCYPTTLDELHLNVLHSYKLYNLPLGLSCHSPWYYVALIAQGYGAEWFEFHITTNRENKGTDHSFSLLFDELKDLCNLLQIADQTTGNLHKTVLESEKYYIKKLRGDL